MQLWGGVEVSFETWWRGGGLRGAIGREGLRAEGEEDEEGDYDAGDEDPAAPGVPVGVAVIVV